MNKKVILVTEGLGYGFFALLVAKAFELVPIAFSSKDTQADFEQEVEQIYSNLSFFAPTLRKAMWSERETLLESGWDVRQSLIDREITVEMWEKIAKAKLVPTIEEDLPQFRLNKHNILFIPQKLQIGGMREYSIPQQSLRPEYFYFMQQEALVLGQHFDKVEDLEKVEDLTYEFDLYVPGMTENEEVFGIRGVAHKKLWNLYSQLVGSIGVVGTHTWYLLACRPEVPQIILYSKDCVENWDDIAKTYRNAGYPIYSFRFEKGTNSQMYKFMKSVAVCFWCDICSY